MSLRIFQVDAFASKAFQGNAAVVCLLEQQNNVNYDSAWMQAVAAEMNVSETAFVEQKEEGLYTLRWFTPTTEVNLCGHATLATAHILWQQTAINQQQIINFDTRSGRLSVSNKKGLITMNFPLETVKKVEDKALKQQISNILACDLMGIYTSTEDIVVEVASEKILKNLQPDFQQLAMLPLRCLVVTSASKQYDFVSRVFAPAIGIDEDPVTGSVHCALTPFWAEKLAKNQLTARQISARGGNLFLTLNNQRVDISGTAITVFKGELL